MARFSLFIKRSAARELEAVGQLADRRRIVERIRKLATDPRPHGCEKLSGRGYYRLRQGSYRMLYEVDDEEQIVTVVKIGHRKDVYR